MSDFIPYRMPRYSETEILKRARSMQELMQTRRSVRSFSHRPVNERVVEALLSTAVSAPSGANLQPWHFCVITNPDLKRRIRKAVEAEESQNYAERFPAAWRKDLEQFATDHIKQFIDDAPVLVVCFKQMYREHNGEKIKNYYVTESVCIAIGMLIAAIHHAGLATLPHTPNPMRFMNELLGRPENERPVVVLPIGYPADDAEVPDLKRKDEEDVITCYR
jgi:nitroreductase